ncbi:hypothetical protein A2957_01755 [Candidatus Roizmanbacteria bacterium RIFCSPLOWO2_01_FULL_38_11]|uniref:alanine--tRNA ligase n=1 Tax=Candidatus Roizmanbacteria bacterium RIFCSPLOWO2_01_FULL_38_11 TaxID=1802060 RepID=A0A1F7IL11_9BACT|nr:MAG: hypothetical protein A2957_01755 [Candidatus Roizmanbacteria bacterium RIFCSPLOWO2_01_FULL_38_11]
MGHVQLRELFLDFWKSKDHVVIKPASLVLQNDATTLFTSSGMQPLVPYLLGESHPKGSLLCDIQPCIRTQDIEEVGDNRHTTFFEMLGNWSLGKYFKEEQLAWKWEFLTKHLNLPTEKLYVTVFEGGMAVPKDEESARIWKSLGVLEDRIGYYGFDKSWWSRSGTPETMPEGEIGGPSSEVFYDFGKDLKLHEASPYKDQACHPNCDCGRFIEICNSVFIQYLKENDNLIELKQRNVDFGGGLERILMAINNNSDIFSTDVFSSIMKEIEEGTQKKYSDDKNKREMRVIADHIKAAVFLIVSGVIPSNKQQGYVLRRLLRRSAVAMYLLSGQISGNLLNIVDNGVLATYDKFGSKDHYLIDRDRDRGMVMSIISKEIETFSETLERALRRFDKLDDDQLDMEAFNLYSSYGFPFEVTQELSKKRGVDISKRTFDELNKTHKELSQKVSSGFFKGGLADHSDQVIKYHTTTHLLHQALKDVFGPDVRQEGSNITTERLRFDARLKDKPSDEDIKRVEDLINKKIEASLPVYFLIMPKEDAEKIGAASFFKEKYDDMVKVYCIGGDPEHLDKAYSKEFCGGPHASNTSEIGIIKITKIKKIGDSLVRFYLE